MVSKLKKKDNAYVLLTAVLLFGAIITMVNYVAVTLPSGVDGDEIELEEYNDDNFIDPWSDPLGWIGQQISGNPVFDFFTLDITILTDLGELSNIIRVVYGALIVIGIIDILWIG